MEMLVALLEKEEGQQNQPGLHLMGIPKLYKL